MAYIYKTGRAELQDQVKSHASVINGKVLDIGAGSHPRYKHLFKFEQYVCMDIEPGNGIDVVGKIESIPFPDNSFESIVCTQVLGDVFDLQNAFLEIKRVLKPGGKALITESLFDPLHDEPHDFWRFTPHSFKKLAENTGLEVNILEKRGGYRSVMAQLKARYWIERLNAGKKRYARFLSIFFKIVGEWARHKDSKDKSEANAKFTHGFLLIVEKKND